MLIYNFMNVCEHPRFFGELLWASLGTYFYTFVFVD
jgi:hypothetical protein